MTLVNCGFLPQPQPLGVISFGTSSLIDAADEYVFSSFTIQRSGGGNISRVHWRNNTIATTAVVDLRIETPSTTGGPSGTLWAANTNVAQTILSTADNTLVRSSALTASATVALGDVIIIALRNDTILFGDANISRAPVVLGLRGYPYPGGPLATNKTDNAGANFAIEYEDGVIELPAGQLPGACTPASLSFSTGTNPDELGLHFTAPFDGRVIGWWLFGALTAGLTFRMSLYQASSDTPLATATFDTDLTGSVGGRLYMSAYDDTTTGITIAAGTAYRCTCVALSGTAITLYRTTAERAAFFASLGLPGAQQTARNRSSTTDPDSATWTETDTILPQMGIIFDQIDDGAGSGGGGLIAASLIAGGG